MWQNLPTFSGEGGQDITITFIDLVEAFVKLQHWFCKKLEMTTPAQIKVTCMLITIHQHLSSCWFYFMK